MPEESIQADSYIATCSAVLTNDEHVIYKQTSYQHYSYT